MSSKTCQIVLDTNFDRKIARFVYIFFTLMIFWRLIFEIKPYRFQNSQKFVKSQTEINKMYVQIVISREFHIQYETRRFTKTGPYSLLDSRLVLLIGNGRGGPSTWRCSRRGPYKVENQVWGEKLSSRERSQAAMPTIAQAKAQGLSVQTIQNLVNLLLTH